MLHVRAASLETATYNVAPGVFALTDSFGFLNVTGKGESVSPVSLPEPGTPALCALAAAGPLVMQRRRRRVCVAREGSR